MFNRLRKRVRSVGTYVDFYIILSGDHVVPIMGLTGISLKKVDRVVWEKHKGLKYWIGSKSQFKLKHQSTLEQLSQKARRDVFNRVFYKRTEDYGIMV